MTARVVALSSVSGVAMLALLGSVLSSFHQQNERLQATLNDLQHTQQFVNSVESYISLMKDVETGMRGYVITGNVAFLEPYNEAERAFPSLVPQLEQFTAADATQRASLNNLESDRLAHGRYETRVIELRRENHVAAASTLIATGEGKPLMDHMRATTAQMISHEQAILTQRIADLKRYRQDLDNWLKLLAAGIGGVFVLNAGGAIYVVRTQKKTENTVKLLNAKLQEKMQENERAREQAVEAFRSRSEFVANMSHEIRTPMNGVLGMAEILRRSTQDPTLVHYIETIREAGQSLLSLLNDILDFSKLESGKMQLELTEFQPVQAVEGVAELFSGQAQQKNLSLVTFIDPNIPPVVIGDGNRLRQILANVTANAVKFSETGEVLIRATRAHEPVPGKVHLLFEVIDSGIGISEEQVKELFKPFKQADGTMTRKYGGTGLGLAISKSFIDLMEGEIGVDSTPGQGSRFWFMVPLMVSEKAQKHPPKGNRIKDCKVLVVDDEPFSRDVLASYLQSWEMERSTAATGEEALVALKRECDLGAPFDVALIDLIMPDMDGIELGREIKADPRLRSTHLILITAHDGAEVGKRAIAAGFGAFLTKPLHQSTLLDCISSVISGEPARLAAHRLIATPESAESAPPTIPTRSELLLIVEDHPINQEVALILLRQLGFEAHVASNGKEALERLAIYPYDLIFMDVQMPIMDGLTATREIRKRESKSGVHVPIIAMTAHAMEGSREQCIAAGMNNFLTKPIEPSALSALLSEVLPVHRDPGQMLDYAAVERLYTKEGVDKMLNMLLQQAPTEFANIKASLAEGDTKRVAYSAHALKGVFAGLRAQTCQDLFGDLEQRARSGEDAPALMELAGQCEENMNSLLAQVRRRLSMEG